MSAISKINVNGTNYDILGLPVGTIFASALPQTNSGVHLLDGSYIATNGIYNQFCTLVEDLNVDYDILCTEEEYTEDITNTGNCGKFVLDTTNNTLRLPTITTFIQGLSDLTTLGQAVEAGLPNITGSVGQNYNQTGVNGGWHNYNNAGGGGQGALYLSGTGNGSSCTWSNYSDAGKIAFDASRSNSIYGNSTTVQPASVKYPYYIVLATSKKTDIEVDIDEVASDINQLQSDINRLNNSVKIIETYINGTSGYRIWSDGYCEQWGRASLNECSTSGVQLLKKYADTNYNVGAIQTNISTNGDTEMGMGANPASVSSITLFCHYINPNTMTVSWRTAGYLAEGEY